MGTKTIVQDIKTMLKHPKINASIKNFEGKQAYELTKNNNILLEFKLYFKEKQEKLSDIQVEPKQKTEIQLEEKQLQKKSRSKNEDAKTNYKSSGTLCNKTPRDSLKKDAFSKLLESGWDMNQSISKV